jgi:hypothetical protein
MNYLRKIEVSHRISQNYKLGLFMYIVGATYNLPTGGELELEIGNLL